MISADEDELVAEIVGVLDELVAERRLELATRRDSTENLAMCLLSLLERDVHANIGDWLLDRDEVTELYVEQDELHVRFRSVIARMSGDEPSVKYHPVLAAAIAAAPEDWQARAVYADWLIEQGDPRGELMAIQLALTAGRSDRRLADRERALLARHRRHFLGDLGRGAIVEGRPEGVAGYVLRHGFLDEATVSNAHDLQALLALESARFLRKISVNFALGEVGERLAASSLPSTLVELALGDGRGGSLDLARASGGLARLEVLIVRRATALTLPPLDVRTLRQLVVYAEALQIHEAAFEALPRLERLELRASTIAPHAALVALFAAPPSGLTELAITGMESASAVLQSLLASPLASTLRHLDLRCNHLTSDDLSLLLTRRERLARLETLCLVKNRISDPLRRQLQEAWPEANVEFSDDNE